MARAKAVLRKSPVAFVSDYLPRRCGIATFTYDLSEAVAAEQGGKSGLFVVAINDVPEGYPYSERVRFEVRQAVQADYRLAAEFLNFNQVSAVCLQHEYGIFGGTSGSHVLALLRRLRRPVVVTLHTILKEPNDQQSIVLREIARMADRLVTMSDLAHDILHDVYEIPREKIRTIPHGILDVPFVDPNFYKDKFGVEGRKVMLTFGLLSPGKGIEYVIEALPAILKKHPDLVYIVLGATHPHVKRSSGEEYRNSLYRRVHELNLDDHVIFQNRFVELSELGEFLGAADIYVTPYLSEAQITSGTLAYALGAGKAVVSTPYWYAQEMLAEDRGRLVPFRNSDAIAEQVIDLLDDEVSRHAMRKRAYNFCRKMTWKRVARSYLELFSEACDAWVARRHPVVAADSRKKSQKIEELPEVDLRHLRLLTDDTGILQHCLYATPNRSHGYCTDDNARALIVAVMHWDQTRNPEAIPLMQKYLSYIAHAMNTKTGRFHNFLDYDRTWAEKGDSEDSHARALWGLGMAVALCPHESMIALATKLFIRGLPAVERFSSPRSWAFIIVGLHAYLRRFGGDSEVRRLRALLTERLVERFAANMADDWPWLEDEVTYANAKLPHALLMSGKWMQRGDIIDIGKKSLEWLLRIQTNDSGMLSIIGSNGWYVRGQQAAQFDQQPIEAHALVDACIEAYHVTRERKWLNEARKAFNWFLGDNDLRTPIYDFTTGGCRDGLHSDRVNENQGAESTLAWLMSLLLMHDVQMEQTLGGVPADKEMEQRPVHKPIGSSGPVVKAKVKENARPNSNDK
ncbi:MAG: glycosyltransferase family 4 protein [Planctomycetota bacterium]|nr:glycosyltransferase family 4 protein [Planctomycetota bacterium]